MKVAPRKGPKPNAWRLPGKVWVLIIVSAVGIHVAAYFLATQVTIKKPRHIPRPNFNGYEEITVDPATGVRTIHREFVVSTKLEGWNEPPPPMTDD